MRVASQKNRRPVSTFQKCSGNLRSSTLNGTSKCVQKRALHRNISVIFGRPFVKLFALCYRTVVCPVCAVLSVGNVGVLWPNGWTDQPWQVDMSRPWPHCVRWGHRSPSPKGPPPIFGKYICCGQMARRIKMPLGRKIGLNPSHIVLDGDAPPFPQKGAELLPNSRTMSIVSKRLDGSICHLIWK